MRIPHAIALSALLPLLLYGCKDDKKSDECVLFDPEGCEMGLVCAPVVGGTTGCFAPIEVHGNVFDALDGSPVEGATVVALDANGAARSPVAVTDMNGDYELELPAVRNEDGTIVTERVTLRVDAADYQTFPTAPRTALPIEISDAEVVDTDGVLVVANAATDVALIPHPDDTTGFATIRGRIDHEDGEGVLIVAEQGGRAVSTAVSGLDEEFTLFNVPPGSTEVSGYRQFLRVDPATVDVSGDIDDLVLTAGTDGLATVSGQVNIVDAPGGSITSVILVVESTFVPPPVARGESPAGLRADSVSGAFSIEGVPPGDYAVLAAFENDGLVRDPDEGIAGTDIVMITVTGADQTIDQGFKVTGALDVVSPGANSVDVVSGTPTFVWSDDSSEDGYELFLFDAYGETVFEDLDVARVTGSPTVSVTYSGPGLTSGMIYQFRARSWRDRTGGRSYISATEDLKGVFRYQP